MIQILYIIYHNTAGCHIKNTIENLGLTAKLKYHRKTNDVWGSSGSDYGYCRILTVLR
jgi:hypothetical protein